MKSKMFENTNRKQILSAVGMNKEIERAEQGRCPTCGKRIYEEDFRDEISRREFHISSLCQSCQDKVFGA